MVDLHVDLSFQVNYKHQAPATASGQLVASRLLEAGVVGLVLPLYIPHEVSPSGPRMADLESSYASMLQVLTGTPPYTAPGQPNETGRVETWFSFEGAAPFSDRLQDVTTWVHRGVKIWGLVHVHDNALATSAGAGPHRIAHKTGLTAAGHSLVQAVHAAGGVIDVSHASDSAVLDVIEHAQQDRVPVVATHSNANRLAPHARNLTDEQLRAIASTGGVIGVNFHGKFLARGRRATVTDVVQHIRYIADLVGIEHVALGSDYEGGIAPPKGLEDARGYQALARALLASGLSREDIRRVFAGNALSLLSSQNRTTKAP